MIPPKEHVPGTWAWVIATVARETGFTQTDVRRVAEHLFEVIKDSAWSHRRMVVPGFIAIRISRHRARKVVNPADRNGPLLRLPAREHVAIRATRFWRSRGHGLEEAPRAR